VKFALCRTVEIVVLAVLLEMLSLHAASDRGQPAKKVSASQATEIKVTLLGTGTPEPRPDRFGPSTLVEAGGERLVFDCGRGCTTRLWQLRLPLGSVKLFLTHLHSDHTVGIPDLWLTGWLTQPYGTRKEKFHVWGPLGTAEMMAKMEAAYAEDVRIRREFNPSLTAEQVGVDAHDIGEGIVYENAGVRVTAFKVRHANVKEAFGYRVDHQGHSVIISGDMAPNDNFRKHAANADVIIHEVGAANPDLLASSPRLQRLLLEHHSSPEDVGRDFAAVKPKLGVLTHYTVLQSEGYPEVALLEIVARVRKEYSGPLEAGQDLTAIIIGDHVTVRRATSE